MGSKQDKARGIANQVKGQIKQAVGRGVGNPDLQAEGEDQEFQGRLQKNIGKAKDAASGLLKTAGQAIKKSGK